MTLVRFSIRSWLSHGPLQRHRQWVLGVLLGIFVYDGLSNLIETLPWSLKAIDVALEGGKDAAVMFFLAWLLYRQPARWGLRFGVLMLVGLIFFITILLLAVRHLKPEESMYSLVRDFGLEHFWGRVKFGLCFLFRTVEGVACLSLRWLYAPVAREEYASVVLQPEAGNETEPAHLNSAVGTAGLTDRQR